MAQFLLLLIMLSSLGGIVYILYRKIPLLLELPSQKGEDVRISRKITSLAQKKIFGTTLSKARNLASKTESHTSEWMEKLRKKSEQHKEDFQESYWDQLRKKSRKK